MNRTLKAEAIVLRRYNLASKDAIYVFFTQQYGKIRCYAKGIKKITSRRLPHLQTGNLINAMVREHNTLFYVENTNLISGFTTIKNNQEKLRTLYFLFFMIERLLPENQSEIEIYDTVKTFEIRLAKETGDCRKILNEFANKILMKLGYSKDQLSPEQIITTVEDLVHERIPEFVK